MMKGNEKIIEVLNSLLADELTAVNEYVVHSKMCQNWGYEKLYKAIMGQAMDEMHHAEWLIERIIFLDGLPTVSKLNQINIGKTVSEMIKNTDDDELNAIYSYNHAIDIARGFKDQGTVDLLTKILKMEEGHVDWADIQRTQMDQMGMQNYLVNQSAPIN